MAYRGSTRWPVCPKLLAVIALTAAVSVGPGCRRVSSAKAGAGGGVAADQMASPSEVIQAYRPSLAVVETTWDQKSSYIGGWSRRGVEGTGLVVASDGRTALVLTSRHMVDPRYIVASSTRTQDVMFRVRVSGPGGSSVWKEARLVAVYIHEADLALLRIGAPSGRPFSLPVARSASLRAGDSVVVVGPPAAGGLVQATGVIESVWEDRRLGSGAMQIRVSDGHPATAGLVFTRRGGRLVGVLRGQQEAPVGQVGDLFAVSADALCRADFWSHLLEEGNTRHLLARIR